VAAPGKTTSVSTATTPQSNGGIAGHGGANAGAVVTMGELPPAIQQELPAMNISVHAYSPTPGSRLVGINNQMFKEGSQVAPGLELEQITPEGMVFGYKGYHFRRGVK
jgi:general secretion pathway protein B